MNEQKMTPWHGTWQLRAQCELERPGYRDLVEYFDVHPGVGYTELAARLERANVAGMQLYGEQIRAAGESGYIRESAANSLSRFLAQHVKRGWGCGRHFALRAASAFGDWKTVIRRFYEEPEPIEQRLDAVTEAIKASNPPQGCLPTGADDAIIQAAFEEGWPHSQI